MDDIDRLFSYRGATVEPEVAVLGPDILTVRFWTPQMCAAVVRAADAVGAWEPHPDDPVPGSEISLASLVPRLYAHVEDHLYSLVWPALAVHWPTTEFAGLQDAFVIRYDATERPDLPLHHDVAQISASLRLNDDYQGGELEFPRQGIDNRDVPVGTLVMWPSLVTHPHRSAPVRVGTKYGLTIWCAIPGAVVGAQA